MRPTLLAAALLCAALSPAVGQDAGTVEPSEAAKQAMWCGAAFGVLHERATVADEAAQAAAFDGKANVAFSKAAAELIPAGMTVEQFGELAGTYVEQVTAPFRDSNFSEAECEALVAAE
jgi:hypothetical protein